MAIGNRLFNPLDLTVGKAGSTRLLYPGQVDTVSANGLAYAGFSNLSDGVSAGEDYIGRHGVGHTLSDYIGYFLNGSVGLKNTKDNPHALQYLQQVSQNTGIAPGQIITTGDAHKLVLAQSKSEGTYGLFTAGNGMMNLNTGVSSGSFINSDGSVAISRTGHALANGTPIGPEGTIGNVKPAGDAVPPNPFAALNALATALQSGTLWERVALVVLGLALIVVALTALGAKPLGEIASKLPPVIPV